MASDVNLEELAERTDSFTGADLAGLVRQASLQALRESLEVENTCESDIDLSVKSRHFILALQHLRPSVTTEVNDLMDFSMADFFFYTNFSFFRTKFNMNCYG